MIQVCLRLATGACSLGETCEILHDDAEHRGGQQKQERAYYRPVTPAEDPHGKRVGEAKGGAD
jgi:hypothetical protein